MAELQGVPSLPERRAARTKAASQIVVTECKTPGCTEKVTNDLGSQGRRAVFHDKDCKTAFEKERRRKVALREVHATAVATLDEQLVAYGVKSEPAVETVSDVQAVLDQLMQTLAANPDANALAEVVKLRYSLS